jgi:hypothetical protein
VEAVLVVEQMLLAVQAVLILYLAPLLLLVAVLVETVLVLLLKMVDREAVEVDFLHTPAEQGTLLTHRQAKETMVVTEQHQVELAVAAGQQQQGLMLLVVTRQTEVTEPHRLYLDLA